MANRDKRVTHQKQPDLDTHSNTDTRCCCLVHAGRFDDCPDCPIHGGKDV